MKVPLCAAFVLLFACLPEASADITIRVIYKDKDGKDVPVSCAKVEILTLGRNSTIDCAVTDRIGSATSLQVPSIPGKTQSLAIIVVPCHNPGLKKWSKAVSVKDGGVLVVTLSAYR